MFEKIPIVDTARWCGLVLDSWTLRRREVEASCPFCGDHGRGKYHLSLNTATDQFRCNRCGAHGNSVTLYARLNGLTDTLRDLGVTEVVEAVDMDQNTKPEVRNAILSMRKEIQAIKRWKYTKYTWDPDYKGLDDYLLSRVAAI